MRTIKCACSMLLICVAMLAKAGDPGYLTQLKAPVVRVEPTPAPASVMRGSHLRGGAFDPCAEYKRKQIAGFVILPIGVGTLIAGSVMVYKGTNNIINAVSNRTYPEQANIQISRHDVVMVSVGAALGVVGLALTPTGLGLGIGGTVKYNNYCGRRAYYIEPAKEGVGLACSF